MNLGEYIDWHQSIEFEDMYTQYQKIHNPNVPGYLLPGKVEIPDDLVNALINRDPGKQPEWLGVKSNYRVQYDDRLVEWAKKTFPNLQFVKCRLQSQKPGESVREHMDLLGTYLRGITEATGDNKPHAPWLRKLRHSIEKPGIDIHQLLIACDDQVDGQVIGFYNPGPWNWKKGDILRINTWRGMHWTENKSNKIRHILKVTGIELGMKKENHAIA
jgi:hypothetical protein